MAGFGVSGIQARLGRWMALGLSVLLSACAATKFTVDDGRPVNPELLGNIQLYGQGEGALRPAIARSAALKDKDCDRQWELPFSLATSQGWDEADRVAWVRALGVDERLTVVGVAPGSPLKRGERLVAVEGYTNSNAQKLLLELARLRDRGQAFKISTAAGRSVSVLPFQVCRGYTRLAPPNSAQLQDYHWLMSFHPLEVAKSDLSEDEALWVVLWTQGVSEEGGARMKTYHYGTSILSSLYTVATLASGLKGAAIAAEAAINTARQAAASAASEVLKQQLINQAKQFATDRLREEAGKSIQSLTQAQVASSMQQLAANRGLLSGLSRIAATIFDRADLWAYGRMQQLGANPLAGYALHQKLMERGLLSNSLAFDPERMTNLQVASDKDGRKEDVLAILKGIRPENLKFESDEMPLASASREFSYEDAQLRSANPYSRGLVEAMLELPDSGLTSGSASPK